MPIVGGDMDGLAKVSYPSIRLSVYLSICPSVCLSICLSRLSIHIAIFLSCNLYLYLVISTNMNSHWALRICTVPNGSMFTTCLLRAHFLAKLRVSLSSIYLRKRPVAAHDPQRLHRTRGVKASAGPRRSMWES